MQQSDPIGDYLFNLGEVIRNISHEQVWSVVNVLMCAWRERKRIYLIGNGGSATTASHMANDLNKYTIVSGKPRFKAISLCDNVPLITAWSNDTSYEDIFVQQLEGFLEQGDVVIGISTSGNSPNVVKALSMAKRYGAKTIGFTGDHGGQLKDIVDNCIFIPSSHIGQQEDGHMILDHVIASTLKTLIESEEI
jgi:D-sedoheptulose 7-phosphate isomerase